MYLAYDGIQHLRVRQPWSQSLLPTTLITNYKKSTSPPKTWKAPFEVISTSNAMVRYNHGQTNYGTKNPEATKPSCPSSGIMVV